MSKPGQIKSRINQKKATKNHLNITSDRRSHLSPAFNGWPSCRRFGCKDVEVKKFCCSSLATNICCRVAHLIKDKGGSFFWLHKNFVTMIVRVGIAVKHGGTICLSWHCVEVDVHLSKQLITTHHQEKVTKELTVHQDLSSTLLV